ncbi:MAG: hypothetical protein H6713_03445 [Myxococcales bacterium]|nr:hypothetical protein [Myxococcales bacterium]MCB9749044.1 hypothetical protein [Myxococcales bacterium]
MQRLLGSSRRTWLIGSLGMLALLGPLSCGGGGGLSNELDAERAYLGLDEAVDRAIKLGFDGFNAATNANIPDQSEGGALQGTMVVGGQVDQGNSNNKEMRLLVELTDYSDVVVENDYNIIYNGGPANLDMSLKGLPNAELTGTFVGTFTMDGDLVGPVELNLEIVGMTEDAGGIIQRAPGTTRIFGTATSDFGVFDVDVTR